MKRLTKAIGKRINCGRSYTQLKGPDGKQAAGPGSGVSLHLCCRTRPHTGRLLKKIIRKVWGRQGTEGLALLRSRLLGSGRDEEL